VSTYEARPTRAISPLLSGNWTGRTVIRDRAGLDLHANPELELEVKADLHPVYRKVTAVCACGNSFETRSTASSIHVEVCAQCHPYFTGKQRLVDTAGRVDRFRRKYQAEPAGAAPKA
jgi:large subunit ribosomal protein L31